MAPNNTRDVSDHFFILKMCPLQRSHLPGLNQLPEEVFVDILCLLPIKILVQCKCVSKAWYRLISYVCVPRICSTLPPIDGFLCRVEDFINDGNIIMDYISFDDPDNLEVASANPRMLEMGGTTGGFVGRYTTLLPFKPSPDCLLDVCHGLLLFVRWCLSTGSQYYVCNPTTKQCVRIPKASFDMKQDCYATLVFNPFESPHYKVVRFLGGILDIFSSDTGMWVKHKFLFKPLGALNDDEERHMLPRSCYLDGPMGLCIDCLG